MIVISPPCLASCRRCTTREQKEEPGPRRFADFCAPTVPARWGPETPGLAGQQGFCCRGCQVVVPDVVGVASGQTVEIRPVSRY